MTLEADLRGERIQVCRSVRKNRKDVVSLAWVAWRKEINRATSRNKCRFLIKVTGWGPGSQIPGGRGVRLGAGPGREKSPSGRQAKGWETAETAAAEVGAWRETGTGYPPYPAPPAREKRRGFSPSPLLKLSNTPPKVGGLHTSS